ncbi:MAG: hypothetical protein QXF76_02375 [Candidatus Anstonellales archaeon]
MSDDPTKNNNESITAHGTIEDVHVYFNSIFLPIFEKLYNDPKTRIIAIKVANSFAILDQTLVNYEKAMRDENLPYGKKVEIKNKTLETVKIYIKMLELAEKKDEKSIDEYINLLNERYKEKLEFSFADNRFKVIVKKND